jgi:hypothetical protein
MIAKTARRGSGNLRQGADPARAVTMSEAKAELASLASLNQIDECTHFGHTRILSRLRGMGRCGDLVNEGGTENMIEQLRGSEQNRACPTRYFAK